MGVICQPAMEKRGGLSPSLSNEEETFFKPWHVNNVIITLYAAKIKYISSV